MAKTNAKVVVSQQGRVLYETLVAAGPFRIQDLNDAVSGSLDVRVEEQDGSVHSFQLDTAGVPYLTRPGQVRYKLATGRPSNLQYNGDGDFFGTGEFSWGSAMAGRCLAAGSRITITMRCPSALGVTCSRSGPCRWMSPSPRQPSGMSGSRANPTASNTPSTLSSTTAR